MERGAIVMQRAPSSFLPPYCSSITEQARWVDPALFMGPCHHNTHIITSQKL